MLGAQLLRLQAWDSLRGRHTHCRMLMLTRVLGQNVPSRGESFPDVVGSCPGSRTFYHPGVASSCSASASADASDGGERQVGIEPSQVVKVAGDDAGVVIGGHR